MKRFYVFFTLLLVTFSLAFVGKPVRASLLDPVTYSQAGAPICHDVAPNGAPNLFQIDTAKSSATLHFTTVKGSDGYQVFYGTDVNASQFAGSFSYSGPLWTLTHTVNRLNTKVKYYFKVRATKGCAGGDFSNTASSTVSSTPVIVATPTSISVPTTTSRVDATKFKGSPSWFILGILTASTLLFLLLSKKKSKKGK
ncbi:MAG TPA: hypothetical protein VKC54_04740 [Patescibacteria group bacterium]|nr:hypothetical protein [Patescibacteria group bacterium]